MLQLEDENSRLKKIVAQQALELDALKVVLVKKVVGLLAEREAARVVQEEAGLKGDGAIHVIGSLGERQPWVVTKLEFQPSKILIV